MLYPSDSFFHTGMDYGVPFCGSIKPNIQSTKIQSFQEATMQMVMHMPSLPNGEMHFAFQHKYLFLRTLH